jgi:hypothetical protein
VFHSPIITVLFLLVGILIFFFKKIRDKMMQPRSKKMKESPIQIQIHCPPQIHRPPSGPNPAGNHLRASSVHQSTAKQSRAIYHCQILEHLVDLLAMLYHGFKFLLWRLGIKPCSFVSNAYSRG